MVGITSTSVAHMASTFADSRQRVRGIRMQPQTHGHRFPADVVHRQCDCNSSSASEFLPRAVPERPCVGGVPIGDRQAVARALMIPYDRQP
jgi:hypothetical protein